MNKLPTPKKTKKKFYNKFIYKVSLNLDGASALRYHDINEIINKCVTNSGASSGARWRDKVEQDVKKNANTWISLISILNNYNKKSWRKRLEGDCIDFYTNEKSLYDKLCDNFSEHCVIRFEPKKGHEYQLINSDKEIFVDKLPHDKYNYKVFLKPHKVSKEDKPALISWLEKQKPKITFTESIKKWVLSNETNWDRRYIYIDNESTLLMIKLRSQDIIGRVLKYRINR